MFRWVSVHVVVYTFVCISEVEYFTFTDVFILKRLTFTTEYYSFRELSSKGLAQGSFSGKLVVVGDLLVSGPVP